MPWGVSGGGVLALSACAHPLPRVLTHTHTHTRAFFQRKMEIRDVPIQPSYGCAVDGCDRLFASTEEYRCHISTEHTPVGICEVPDCVKLVEVAFMDEHIRRVHSVLSVPAITEWDAPIPDMAVPMEELPVEDIVHQCPVCAAVLTTAGNLTRHMATHNNIGLKCSECDRRFSNKNNLKRHVESQHRGIPRRSNARVCHKCGCALANSKAYAKHVIHCEKEPLPWVCPHCHLVCMNSTGLQNHMQRCKQAPSV